MSLGSTFNPHSATKTCAESARRPKKKRLAPFSIRLSEEERARLAMEAAGAPLGAYIKAKVLGAPAIRSRRTGLAVQDRAALAQGLALLGRSRMASNLNQLARAVHIGSLPLTPETEQDLKDTLQAVRELRRLFVTALGLKAEDAP